MAFFDGEVPFQNIQQMSPFANKKNPLDISGFFGGMGGAAKTAIPDTPSFQTDPSKMQGGNYSGLARAMMERNAGAAGAAREQSLAGLSRAGVSGSDLGRSMADIGAQQELGNTRINQEIAMQDWMDRVARMNAQNQLLQNQYLAGLKAYQTEGEERGLKGAGGLIGGILGSVMG